MKKILGFVLTLTMLLQTAVLAAPMGVDVGEPVETSEEENFNINANAELIGASNVVSYSLAADCNKWVSENFQVWEFKCSGIKAGECDCDAILIDAELVTILQNIRDHFGKPIIINGAYRCEERNNSLTGASKDSSHLRGKAADIY